MIGFFKIAIPTFDSVMDRESKTTTTIGNGVSLPHGSPTAVNESC